MPNYQDRSVKKIMYSKITDEPAVEPVSLSDAKNYLKVDNTADNDLITLLIQAAREVVEQKTNRSLITQTREVNMDWFPLRDTILIPYGPVQTVDSVSYYDEDNVLQTLVENTDYWVDIASDIPRVIVKNSWPGTYDRPNAVTIEYTAGYGDAASDVPKRLRNAVLQMLANMYENRQSVIVSGSPTGVIEMPQGFEYLIAHYVVEHDITY